MVLDNGEALHVLAHIRQRDTGACTRTYHQCYNCYCSDTKAFNSCGVPFVCFNSCVVPCLVLRHTCCIWRYVERQQRKVAHLLLDYISTNCALLS